MLRIEENKCTIGTSENAQKFNPNAELYRAHEYSYLRFRVFFENLMSQAMADVSSKRTYVCNNDGSGIDAAVKEIGQSYSQLVSVLRTF